MKFKGILLDLDGTLYDYEKAHMVATRAVVRQFVTVTGLPQRTILDSIAQAREDVHARLKGFAASHNRLLYFQGACERIGIKPFPIAMECYRLYWDVFLKNMKLYEGVDLFFASFPPSSVVVVSDLTADVQHKKIIEIGLSFRIKSLVTSEEAGQEKPAASIFHLALRKLGVEASDACMIGDDWERDIVGAASLGITPFWFNPSGRLRGEDIKMPAYEVRSFYDVIGQLQ